MTARPLTLTSSTHAFAFAVYGPQVLIGLTLIFGLVTIESLEGLLLLPVVGAIMTGGGAVGLYAIIAAYYSQLKDPALQLEVCACFAVAAVNLFFTVALSIFYGWDTAVPTKVYVTSIGLGCAARIWQINRDRKRLALALLSLSPADTQLAEKKDPDL